MIVFDLVRALLHVAPGLDPVEALDMDLLYTMALLSSHARAMLRSGDNSSDSGPKEHMRADGTIVRSVRSMDDLRALLGGGVRGAGGGGGEK